MTTGGKFLTVDRLNERERRNGLRIKSTYREPTEGEELFITKGPRACLTHITRYVQHHPGTDHFPERTSPHAWCAYFPASAGFEWVPVNDETFVCHACEANARHHGASTFGMIPNTGCEATGGEHFRRRVPVA